jgi:hypothetical protein
MHMPESQDWFPVKEKENTPADHHEHRSEDRKEPPSGPSAGRKAPRGRMGNRFLLW